MHNLKLLLLLLAAVLFTSDALFCEQGSSTECCETKNVGFDPLSATGKRRRVLCCDPAHRLDRVLTNDGLCCPNEEVDSTLNICKSAFKKGGSDFTGMTLSFKACKQKVAKDFRACIDYCIGDKCAANPKCEINKCQKECLKMMDNTATSCNNID